MASKTETEDNGTKSKIFSATLNSETNATLLSHLYRGYVVNRTKEMDRIDNSTGWALTMLAVFLGFAFGSNTDYRLMPLAGIFLIMFWVKEARRYVYYMFWSYKERKMENEIRDALKNGKFNVSEIVRFINLDRTDEAMTFGKAMRVRFFRSYFFMFFMLLSSTFILAYKQGILSNPMARLAFEIVFVLIVFLWIKGYTEFALPRDRIMHMEIHEKGI